MPADELKQQRTLFELEKQKLELERDRALLQAESDRQRAVAERDLLQVLLEQQQLRAPAEQLAAKNQQDLIARIFSLLQRRSPGNPIEKGSSSGYVAELIGFHALKRVSADISRSLAGVIGLGSDVRIMIVDQLDYASGDVPLIELTSHLSVFEVRCRKQITANRELAELVTAGGEREEEEKTGTLKAGLTRFAPLAAAPFVLPAPPSQTALPEETGVVGTAASAAPVLTGEHRAANEVCLFKTSSLVAAVAGSLRSEKRNIYVYNFYALDTTGPQSKLMNMYAGMLDCSSRLAQSRNRLLYFISKKNDELKNLRVRLKKSEEQIAGPPGEGPGPEDLRAAAEEVQLWLERANPAILASDAIHTELGTFVRNITTETMVGGSKLAQAVYREKIRDLGITHILFLRVISSGGESITRRGILGSGNTRHFGGAVVSYLLSRVQGDVLVSDTLPMLFTMEFDPTGEKNSPLRLVRFERPEPRK